MLRTENACETKKTIVKDEAFTGQDCKLNALMRLLHVKHKGMEITCGNVNDDYF
jgi:hypothetical protein